jgi:fibro-slime domain-containing protein
MKMRKVFAAVPVLLLFFAANAGAQGYPGTLNVPVTFFDYHSDGSCPDFNSGTNPGTWLTGMVQNTLDANGLPVRGANLLYSYEIGKWFRPWKQSLLGQGSDNDRPVYGNGGKTLTQLTTAIYDTSYKNVVVQQNLVFTYVAASHGQYQFQKNDFFPLDASGFQTPPATPDPTINFDGNPLNRTTNTHNYSFAAHIHRDFTYTNGATPADQLIFEFRGDDDMWVFINNTLVLDLGGIHNTIHGAFVLANGNAYVWEHFNNNDMSDTMTALAKPVVNLGLIDGATATIDIFYCERQSTGSDIEVTSNIISAPPTSIKMTVVPDLDTIPAGSSRTYTATVMKSDNSECLLCDQNVQWTLTPATTQSSLTPLVGKTATFNAVDAYTRYFVTATFDSTPPDGSPHIHLSWSDTFYVKPGPVTHLNIEPVSDSTASLLNDNYLPQHALAIQGTTLKDSVYAVLRDAFGNWVSHATLAAWLSRNLTVVTVASTTRTQLGEGEITRAALTTASTFVLASQVVNGVTLVDSIQVNVSNVLYSQVQIYVVSPSSPGGKDTIKSLTMRTDQDTTLRAEGLRADNGQWMDLAVHWGNSAGLTFNNTAPASGQAWNFNPLVTGTGTIFIDFTSGTAILRDTVKVVFNPGLPSQEKLYPLPGQPNTATPANQQLPASVTVVAGVPFQIVAKLFDNKNYWLSSKEGANGPIAWTVQELSGSGSTGSLSTTSGSLTKYTGTKAGNIIKITATYVQEPGNPNIVAPQSITISIIPGPPTHLVIEGDSARSRSPNADNPVGTPPFLSSCPFSRSN